MGELLPQEVEDELRAALMARRSGTLLVDFHEGNVTKARITEEIRWERAPRGGRVERG